MLDFKLYNRVYVDRATDKKLNFLAKKWGLSKIKTLKQLILEEYQKQV